MGVGAQTKAEAGFINPVKKWDKHSSCNSNLKRRKQRVQHIQSNPFSSESLLLMAEMEEETLTEFNPAAERWEAAVLMVLL